MQPKPYLLCMLFYALLTITPCLGQDKDTDHELRSSEIQRVRVDFTTPLGYVRHLLLGFTPNNAATDGFDYGYDALNIEDMPDDLSWYIDGSDYVIQGVGAFDESKKYPFHMELTNNGQVSFSLLALENFETPIDVFIFDAFNEEYHQINSHPFTVSHGPGDYLNRYFITFINGNLPDELLSLNDPKSAEAVLSYNQATSVLKIKTDPRVKMESLSLYNLLGQKLIERQNLGGHTTSIQLEAYNKTVLLLRLETNAGIVNRKIRL